MDNKQIEQKMAVMTCSIEVICRVRFVGGREGGNFLVTDHAINFAPPRQPTGFPVFPTTGLTNKWDPANVLHRTWEMWNMSDLSPSIKIWSYVQQ